MPFQAKKNNFLGMPSLAPKQAFWVRSCVPLEFQPDLFLWMERKFSGDECMETEVKRDVMSRDEDEIFVSD